MISPRRGGIPPFACLLRGHTGRGRLAIPLPAVLALALFSCNGGDGPPPPPPTPPPPPPIEMLLRANGPDLVTLGGEPVEFFGAIPCCRTLEFGQAPQPLPLAEGKHTGWPIALHPDWRDYVRGVVGDRPIFYLARLGPWFADQTAEPEWADVGGAYVRNQAGLADLFSFNPAFWDRVYDWSRATAFEVSYLIVSLFDRWWAKQQDIPNPMRAEWNAQHYPMNLNVGRVRIEPNTPEDAYIRQIVCRPDNPAKALGSLPNIIWEDGNEVGLGPYGAEWTFSVKDRVRFWENECQAPVHLFGTNAATLEAEAGPVDYVLRHQTRPVPSPVHGKPSVVSEYNPSPALTPEQLHAYFCEAQSNRTHYAYWRHTQTMDQMSRTLEALASGCAPPATSCPKLLSSSASAYVKNAVYGQGRDSSVRVRGDPEFCRLIHGVSVNDCNLEGWPKSAECAMELIGGCPEWQFRTEALSAQACLQFYPDPSGITCDHFGSPGKRDDPQTPEFEGFPVECGLQRDASGSPKAGFFTQPHGLGEVRACAPNDPANCGNWSFVNHVLP